MPSYSEIVGIKKDAAIQNASESQSRATDQDTRVVIAYNEILQMRQAHKKELEEKWEF